MAAQFTFIKGKEYKVVNWIDGNVYVATFSAAGKESAVRSSVTIAKVMAALSEQAHDDALDADRNYNIRNCSMIRADELRKGDRVITAEGCVTVHTVHARGKEYAVRMTMRGDARTHLCYPHTTVKVLR